MIEDIMQRDGRGWIVISGIIGIARCLGVCVVCEGAETIEHCGEIFNIGCYVVQGYYFSKPILAEEFYQMNDSIQGRYSVGL